MCNKQEHQGIGDNVGGNKIIENNYYNNNDLKNIIDYKINSLKKYNELDYNESYVIEAIKETILENISKEQEKSHNLVPIGHIRNIYKNYIDDIFFEKTIKELNDKGSLVLKKTQVCYVPKGLEYMID